MGAVLDGSMHRDDRLLVAVACSLVLHFGLLSLPALFQSRPEEPEPPKLTARIVEQKPAQAPKLAAEPTPPSPAPAPKAVRPPTPKPAPRAPAPVAPPIIAVPPTPAAPPAPVTVPEPAPVAPAVVAAPPAPQAAAPAAAGPDPGSIAQFRMELLEAAKRHKRYPRAAVDNNWEGKVDLRMVIAANGSIASLSIRKSAGYAALDDEAQKMFRTAKSQLAIPAALRGKEFTVDISAEFYFVKE
jgi:protein TonB